MSYKPTKRMRFRLNLPILLLVVIFAVYSFIFMYDASITNNSNYSAMANDNQFRSTTVTANRGTIYDANGQILAQSATVYNIIIAPNELRAVDDEVIPEGGTLTEKQRQISECAAILSEELGTVTYDEIRDYLTNDETSDKAWIKVASKVDKIVASDILTRANEAELEYNLIYTEEDTKRYYPQGNMAAAVIGFTNYDGDGVYGVEAYYNDYLAGVDGKIITAKDANGNEMPYKNDKSYAAKDGSSVYLTIDSTLQYYCERELEKCVEENDVDNRACAIIMNCKTGAVLAMASTPGYDLNDRSSIYFYKDQQLLAAIDDEEEYNEKYAELREQQWKNKAITELYEPGSVFKVVTGSAALEEKVISLDSTFTCNGVIRVADTDIPCWTLGSHGTQDFTTAMTNSCNPAFIQIGQRLGVTNFCSYFKAFGFTEPTGIDLPGEATGLYYTEDNMGPVELASSSFGQSNTVTPIQMITAYAATINGGYLLQPHVVSKIVDTNGNVIKTTDRTVRRQVISEETSAMMREVLESVVNNKGGSNAYIKGYRIGGKSGTSQKLQKIRETGIEGLYVSSYVGFAPADDPEIIMLVMVDEPQGKDSNGSHVYYGSLVAAPVVSAVFQDALPYLGYYPEYTEAELAELDITVPSVEGKELETAIETLENLNLGYKIVGEGTKVISQVPSSASSIPKNGTVILYTEEDMEKQTTTVPNVLGYSLSEVNSILTNAGLNFKAGDGASSQTGSTAYSQSYAAGTEVPIGTVVEVIFVVKSEG